MKDMKMNVVTVFVVLIGVFALLLGWLWLLDLAYINDNNNVIMAAAIGLIGAIIGGVMSGALTLAGVVHTVRHSREQIKEQARLDDVRERDLILRKINMEKYQEVLRYLYEINRFYMKLFITVRNYLAEEISHDMLKDNIDALEDLIIEQRRGLSACESFIPEYEKFVIPIIKEEQILTALIYDYYTYPDIGEKTNEYLNPIGSLECINRELVNKVVLETVRLNGLIKNELLQLKNS